MESWEWKRDRFQFQYGTIKSHDQDWGRESTANFNSSMVRLKDRSINAMIDFCKFQFQYGTIKRSKGPNKLRAIFQFQFQYGTIKRASLFKEKDGSLISIPVWYD